MKVKMLPHVSQVEGNSSGIARVVEAYFKYLPEFGVELVGPNDEGYDLKAVHAGITGADCDVCHCHGLYWTESDESGPWQFEANAKIVGAVRSAKAVTVPSDWVAQTFRRDMKLHPFVVPHGIDWWDWKSDNIRRENFVLWNKNRGKGVCNPRYLDELAARNDNIRFVSTHGEEASNVTLVGTLPFKEMKELVMHAGIYLTTTRETFGIGILEAMAAGVPVLGFDVGNTAELVEHGVTGYIAKPHDIADLQRGLEYCMNYNQTLSHNSLIRVKDWGWRRAVELVVEAYEYALNEPKPTAAIIIPSYNYGDKVEDAIRSASEQTYTELQDIIIVDDGSDERDKTEAVVDKWKAEDDRVQYVRQSNSGVAVARNRGISMTDAKYVTCLDADDEIDPEFLASLIPPLEMDSALGITYSGLKWLDGDEVLETNWPGEFDYDKQVRGKNQVPTCCVFRREAWSRLGGYRSRYAPEGCGAEDAEFWLRMGSIGYSAKKVADDLFIYNKGGYTNAPGSNYQEPDWLSWHPWVNDDRHPFASVATPGNGMASHPVRRYDEPTISVIIPVGPGHEGSVIQALDSLEAQYYRNWEVIVVWDLKRPLEDMPLEDMYPYTTWIITEGVGTGVARNMGAEEANAPLLLFLDADDWLLPDALGSMLSEFLKEPAIIYSESIGVKLADAAEAEAYRKRGELLEQMNGKVAIRQTVAEYDRDLAVKQPNKKPYFWCYISSLIPKAWHNDVGGFDEELETWEDWDYWIRLAKAGKPFKAVHDMLMVYNYDSGYRREFGNSIKEDVMGKLVSKHEEIDIMPCKGCGSRGSRGSRSSASNSTTSSPTIQPSALNDKDFVECEYVRNKRGSHRVIGFTEFNQKLTDRMRRSGRGWSFDYGYISQGHRLLVHKKDVAVMDWFKPVGARSVSVKPKDVEQTVPVDKKDVPPPAKLEEDGSSNSDDVALIEVRELKDISDDSIGGEFDVQTIPGISARMATELEELGFNSREALSNATVDELMKVKGIGSSRAKSIIHEASNGSNDSPASIEDVLAELGKVL